MPTPLQTIQDHYAASDRGDLDGMTAPFAPSIEWTEMAGFPYAGTYVGPSEVRAGVFGRPVQDWDGYRADPEHFVASGDEVVAFGVYSGTYRATGKYMQARFVHHWVLRDGQVVRFEQYTDTAQVHAAMKLTPAALAAASVAAPDLAAADLVAADLVAAAFVTSPDLVRKKQDTFRA